MSAINLSRRNRLRARKQDVVRQEIWNSAIDLFYAEGFDESTVEQITARAGVSRRTFFRYFSCKEDVLASAVENFVKALAGAIAEDDSDCSSLEVTKRAIPAVLEPALASAERVLHIARRSASAQSAHVRQGSIVHQTLACTFARRAKRDGSPNLEDRALAHMTLFATSLCVEIWLERKTRAFDEIVDEVFCSFARLSGAR